MDAGAASSENAGMSSESLVKIQATEYLRVPQQ